MLRPERKRLACQEDEIDSVEQSLVFEIYRGQHSAVAAGTVSRPINASMPEI